MGLGDFFDRLRGRSRAKEESVAQSFDALVRSIAQGDREPPVEHVEAILAAAGENVESLAHAVSLRRRRLEWASQMEAAKVASQVRLEIEEEIEGFNQALMVAQQQHWQNVSVCRARQAELDHTIRQGADARKHLLADLPRSLHTAYSEARQRERSAAEESQRRALARSDIHDQLTRLRTEEERLRREGDVDTAAQVRRRIETAERQLAEMQRDGWAEANAELNRLTALALEP